MTYIPSHFSAKFYMFYTMKILQTVTGLFITKSLDENIVVKCLSVKA
jgi:hypothetical protein